MALLNTSNTGVRSFDKEMSEDLQSFHLPANTWTHARNAMNSSETGDLGKLGNEPSNYMCGVDPITKESLIPYMIIGIIHITEDKWLVFSTDEVDSEIGIFDEDDCSYVRIVNDQCLNFSRHNLIIGVSRQTSTCTYRAYWDDGRRNPSRSLEFSIEDPINTNSYLNPNSTIPWVIDHASSQCSTAPCNSCPNTDQLDCDKLRLAEYVQVPCIHVEKSTSGGTLLNGSYMVSIAYSIDGQKISDWYSSNVQSLFEHQNVAGSIDVVLDNLDTTFNEMLVAITAIVNQQTVTRIAGVYSTHQQRLSFDMIDNTWITVPVEELPIITPSIEASDATFSVNNFLLRTGPTSRQDFNYQPLANRIVTWWQAVEYPEDYYVKGGNRTGYLRDEVYPFFIRWIWDTGDKSASYHIPGRPARNATEVSNFMNVNSADPTTPTVYLPQPDGGILRQEGIMSYWQSSESYPDDKPEVWNGGGGNPLLGAFNGPSAWGFGAGSDLDLCGKKIRHHKFPENCSGDLLGDGDGTTSTGYYTGNGIIILGVKFKNIAAPVMNDGVTPVPGIVGYEILRGSRSGNKSIIAKGIINHAMKYTDQVNNSTVYFPNYPYNDRNKDPFLTTELEYGANNDGVSLGSIANNIHTFHSPETSFTDPFLAASTMKVYGQMSGNVYGQFALSEKHPKAKLISDLCLFIAGLIGLGIGMTSVHGKKTRNYGTVSKAATGQQVIPGFGIFPSPFADAGWAGLVNPGAVTIAKAAYEGSLGAQLIGYGIAGAGERRFGQDLGWSGVAATQSIASLTPVVGVQPPNDSVSLSEDGYQRTPFAIKVAALATGVAPFFSYFAQGVDSALELMRSVIKYRDYVLRYHSHCFYNSFDCKYRAIYNVYEQNYIGPQLSRFAGADFNNLFRPRTVALRTATIPPAAQPDDEITKIPASWVDALYSDTFVAGDKLIDPTNIRFGPGFTSQNAGSNMTSSGSRQRSHVLFVGLRQEIENQYGQINGVKQLPASFCTYDAPRDGTATSGIVYGGDIYLNRYTEKNTFFFFYDWLYDQPDGAQFNYTKQVMIPWPKYWANFEYYQGDDFIQSLGTSASNIIAAISGAAQNTVMWPSRFSHLDGNDIGFAQQFLNIRLSIKHAWMYLFISGVRDFYVESEYNTALRDWGEKEEQWFYNPYGGMTDTETLFRTDLIKVGNYMKYDQSLSYGKLFLNYVSWGTTQKINYSPYIAETCYTYYPKRTVYSLPQQEGMLKDNWSIFLANNYKDFLSPVTCIKPINKNGAVIFFDDLSPIQFLGVDQLQTDSGTKITIGDGGLFSQPLQNLVNADKSYEYGSCQDRLSVINTPAGLFWVSQNQGKVYQMLGGIKEISNMDMKWWFAKYLPYALTQDFPTFQLTDNPVAGVGCQAVYDNKNSLVYFTKRDYKLREEYKDLITYDTVDPQTGEPVPGTGATFWIDNNTSFELGDQVSTQYFEDASWTISYDPKINSWVSWHDWHPNLLMPGKSTFLSILGRGIWAHNELCDSYCNFYGDDYPFEVEYAVNTQQQVNTLRSVEYNMEAYVYDDNCYDRFHDLDFNFDDAVIYNSEQVSGLLRLTLAQKNKPWQRLNYPIVQANQIDSLYSKVEQKYRINQFWDITADRGEYNPAAQRMIWNTAANGYVRELNNNNLNYQKPSFQHKKFRHFMNYVFLRRRVSGNRKMMMIISSNKNLNSPR